MKRWCLYKSCFLSEWIASNQTIYLTGSHDIYEQSESAAKKIVFLNSIRYNSLLAVGYYKTRRKKYEIKKIEEKEGMCKYSLKKELLKKKFEENSAF